MNHLFVADLHLRDTPPPCRTDDFMAAQWRKLDWLMNRPEVKVIAGDIFDRWTGASDIRRAMPFIYDCAIHFRNSSTPVLVVAGQHDLPNHRFDALSDSALALLIELCPSHDGGGGVRLLSKEPITCGGVDFYGASWGEPIPKPKNTPHTKVLVMHELVWPGRRPPFPGAEGFPAKELLNQLGAKYDLIVTGDNHQTFHKQAHGRWLVNPGAFTRQKADQVDHEPTAFLWDSDDQHIATAITIPHEKGVVSREHIEEREGHDQRMSAFIDRLGNPDVAIGSTFEDNLRKHVEANDVRKPVRDAITEAMP